MRERLSSNFTRRDLSLTGQDSATCVGWSVSVEGSAALVPLSKACRACLVGDRERCQKNLSGATKFPRGPMIMHLCHPSVPPHYLPCSYCPCYLGVVTSTAQAVARHQASVCDSCVSLLNLVKTLFIWILTFAQDSLDKPCASF